MRGRTVLLVVLLVAFSGCQSSQAKIVLITVEPTIDARPTEADVREGPGSFEGTVVDDEYRPLGGALIEVYRRLTDLHFQVKLTTDDSGHFAVRGLAAGEYVVYVGKKGFADDRPRIILVEDGKTTRHEWILSPQASLEPFHTTKKFRTSFHTYACLRSTVQNLVACELGLRSDTGGAPQNLVDETNQTRLEALLVEVDWTVSMPGCDPPMGAHVFSPEQVHPFPAAAYAPTNPYHWDASADHPPARLLIPREGDNETAMHSPARTERNGNEPIRVDGLWRFRIDAFPDRGPLVDVSCAVNQHVDLFTTFFHGMDAPNAFTAR